MARIRFSIWLQQFFNIKEQLATAVSKALLVPKTPVPAGSDAEYESTATKMTSTWLVLSAAKVQLLFMWLRVALICLILL